jgi:hypothetical protein
MSHFCVQFFCHSADIGQEFKVLFSQPIFDGTLDH